MAGLLDNLANAPQETGVGNALMAAAAALLTPSIRGGGLGSAFAAMPQAIQQAQMQSMQNRLYGLKEQQLGFEMDSARREQLSAEEIARNKAEFLGQLQQRGGFKPDMTAQGVAAGFGPADLEKMAGANRWGLPTLTNVGGVGVDPQTWQAVGAVSDPNKPFGQQMGPDGQLRTVANAPLQSYELAKAATGAARNTVSVNMGQKGFENTQGLRKEFGGLPEVKAFKEMQTTADIINTALQNPSPAGDMTAATKFMKMLDPGSVVRESELGMAMSATGMLDRAMNYAQMVISGQKLTPDQRKDFYAVTNKVMGAATNRYNSLVNDYRGEAQKWELDPDSVAKPASAVRSLEDILNQY